MSSTGLSSAPSSRSPTVYISEQPSSSRSCRLMGSTSSRRLGLLVILRLQHAAARAVKEIDHGRPGSRLEPSVIDQREAKANRSATAKLRMAARGVKQDSAWLETVRRSDSSGHASEFIKRWYMQPFGRP